MNKGEKSRLYRVHKVERLEKKRRKKQNKEHAKSGTHLAASSSSSFLYSPRWLQKIMVSDKWLLTHINHTETHMIQQTEQTWKHPHTIYKRKTPSSSLSNPLLSSSFSAILTQRAPLWLRLPWRCVAGSDHSTFIVWATSGGLARALPLSVRVSVHPSLLQRVALERLGRCSCCVSPSAGLNHPSPSLPPSCFSVTVYLCFSSLDSGGAVAIKKNAIKLNKPLPLFQSPFLQHPLHLLVFPSCCYIHNKYTFQYQSLLPGTKTRVGGDESLFLNHLSIWKLVCWDSHTGLSLIQNIFKSKAKTNKKTLIWILYIFYKL